MDTFATNHPQIQGPISKRWLLADQCGILTAVEPAVFLDRDNTLIANTGDLGDPSRVRLLDGVAPALVKLRDAGFRLIVVTNQGGVARGKFTESDVDAVHQRIAQLLADAHGRRNLIDRFYYCPYHPQGAIDEYRRDHSWRKPHPGMILQASRDMELDLRQSWLIGDHQRDVAAGRAAGCQTILVTKSARLAERANPTIVVETFSNAVEMILSNGQGVTEVKPVTSVLTEAEEYNQESEVSETLAESAETVETYAQEGSPATQVLEATTVEAKRTVTEINIEPVDIEPNWPFVETPQPQDQEEVAVVVAEQAQLPTAPAVMTAPVNNEIVNNLEDSEATRQALSDVRRAMLDLSDELRGDRVKRNELTPIKMAAGVFQMLVVLCAFFGLLHVSDPEAFDTVIKWILGGTLLQLITITLVLVEKRG